jgi:hypothetical protein
MTSTTKYADANAFYKELKAFLKALIHVFPEDRDMKLASSSLNIAMMDDPDTVIINTFHTMVWPHRQLIVKREDTFFTQDPNNFFVDVPNANKYQVMLFTKLNTYWSQLSVTNQEIVWDYVEVLYGLATKCV